MAVVRECDEHLGRQASKACTACRSAVVVSTANPLTISKRRQLEAIITICLGQGPASQYSPVASWFNPCPTGAALIPKPFSIRVQHRLPRSQSAMLNGSCFLPIERCDVIWHQWKSPIKPLRETPCSAGGTALHESWHRSPFQVVGPNHLPAEPVDSEMGTPSGSTIVHSPVWMCWTS